MPMSIAFALALQLAAAGQTPVDPSGHWEGTVATPYGDMRVELDLAKNTKGELTATISSPARKLKGFPLNVVAVDGRSVKLEMGAGAGGRLAGDISADGTSMTGTFEGQAGPLPFTLRRTGDAKIDEPPRSARIAKEIEGTWNGKLDIEGGYRVVLTMTNHAEGFATGSFISVDEGGLVMPVAIAQSDSTLKLDVPMTGAMYSAALNGAGELSGTFTTSQGVEVPLTLKRAGGQ